MAAAACSSAPPAGKTKKPFSDERLQSVKGFGLFFFMSHINTRAVHVNVEKNKIKSSSVAWNWDSFVVWDQERILPAAMYV